MKFYMESVMNDAANVALAVFSLPNSGLEGILTQMMATASAAITPEANSIKSQYILSISVFVLFKPTNIDFFQILCVLRLCFIKNSDNQVPKTYFRQNQTMSYERNILALFCSIGIDFNVVSCVKDNGNDSPSLEEPGTEEQKP